jgi:predicted membrane protein
MGTIDARCDKNWKQYRHSPVGKALGGAIVVAVGAVLLARQLGVEFPVWLFTWPVMMIVIGLYIGARHLFRNPGWIVMVTIGSIFLIDKIYTDISISTFFWPLFIIAAGIMMIFKPHRRHHWGRHEAHDYTEAEAAKYRERYKKYYPAADGHIEADSTFETAETIKEDYLDSVSIFGGVKKNILSKNFKGGEITCVMGGAEINLSQADIQGKVTLEVTQVLGGTKLIVPSHWDVQPDMVVAVLGGIEDKRELNSDVSPDKILILRGTTVLGGIEIRSY